MGSILFTDRLLARTCQASNTLLSPSASRLSYFTHHFETVIALHPVGTYNYTVVYLPRLISAELPFHISPRLRIEADISGVPVKGAWQPAFGQWYLMLPMKPLKEAKLRIGSHVEVAFRLLPQDEVDTPVEIQTLVASSKGASKCWNNLSAGKQRAMAHMVSSAKRPETRGARLENVRKVLLGLAPAPWERGNLGKRKSE